MWDQITRWSASFNEIGHSIGFYLVMPWFYLAFHVGLNLHRLANRLAPRSINNRSEPSWLAKGIHGLATVIGALETEVASGLAELLCYLIISPIQIIIWLGGIILSGVLALLFKPFKKGSFIVAEMDPLRISFAIVWKILLAELVVGWFWGAALLPWVTAPYVLIGWSALLFVAAIAQLYIWERDISNLVEPVDFQLAELTLRVPPSFNEVKETFPVEISKYIGWFFWAGCKWHKKSILYEEVVFHVNKIDQALKAGQSVEAKLALQELRQFSTSLSATDKIFWQETATYGMIQHLGEWLEWAYPGVPATASQQITGLLKYVTAWETAEESGVVAKLYKGFRALIKLPTPIAAIKQALMHYIQDCQERPSAALSNFALRISSIATKRPLRLWEPLYWQLVLRSVHIIMPFLEPEDRLVRLGSVSPQGSAYSPSGGPRHQRQHSAISETDMPAAVGQFARSLSPVHPD